LFAPRADAEMVIDVRFLHRDNRHGEQGLAIIGRFATHQNAVAGLQILQLKRSRVF
jgi:hypothetical protein